MQAEVMRYTAPKSGSKSQARQGNGRPGCAGVWWAARQVMFGIIEWSSPLCLEVSVQDKQASSRQSWERMHVNSVV